MFTRYWWTDLTWLCSWSIFSQQSWQLRMVLLTWLFSLLHLSWQWTCNGKSPYLIGYTSSNCSFSTVMSVFRGCLVAMSNHTTMGLSVSGDNHHWEVQDLLRRAVKRGCQASRFCRTGGFLWGFAKSGSLLLINEIMGPYKCPYTWVTGVIFTSISPQQVES